MNLFKNTLRWQSLVALAMLPMAAMALDLDSDKSVSLHGSLQSDILFPQEDEAIGTGTYKDKVLTNTYLDLSILNKYVDAGARFEYLQHPLPGFEPGFKGWGVPHLYARGRYKGVEITAGDFYEQFGSGFILRTYEERSLGIDNSLRGGRLKVTSLDGLRVTALAGVQRNYWEWSTNSWIYGADAEINIDRWSKRLQDHDITWMFGGSWVMKDEAQTEANMVVVPGTNYRLNMPSRVNAFDARTRFQKGSFTVLGEYAWKSQDPSYSNGYIYHKGHAEMLSLSYSKSGFAALVQAKRSEDMSFRSQRDQAGTATFLNNLPAFTYQHTYALAALYPYATQNAPGEWAFQGEFAYTFKRGTALGGKYGTTLKLNASHVRALDLEYLSAPIGASTVGSDGYKSKFFGFGKEVFYQDINVQFEKKFNKVVKLNLMYMNQRYNKGVVENHGGMVNSNIFVAEGKFQFNRKFTLRSELQFLQTKEDEGNWAYGLVEFSVMPHFMFTLSDMWNCGVTKNHYYMGSVTYTHKAHRLQVGYGRTRAGYNCSGGVCRYVPATKGAQVSYNFSF